MRNLIEDFPAQLRRGIKVAESLRFVAPATSIRNVLVAGMGGSGIGGSLVEALVNNECPVPIAVLKSYDVPAWVGPETLFIASSFSGNTEETLAALQQAFDRSATVAAITSGGKVLQLAEERGLTLAKIPAEAPAPRAFLGYSFIQLLFVLRAYDLIGDSFGNDLEAGISYLEHNQVGIRQEAERLADLLVDKLPVVYADARLLPVILRLQQQINENAKQLCHVNVFPEMNHNELVGWVYPKPSLSQTVTLLVQSGYDHPRVRMRMEVCQPILAAASGYVETITAQGQSFLEQCLYLINLFDWTSLLLAERNGVDPFPVAVIDQLKNSLAGK